MNSLITATSLTAGLAAGLAVLFIPRRRADADPTSRLSKLTLPARDPTSGGGPRPQAGPRSEGDTRSSFGTVPGSESDLESLGRPSSARPPSTRPSSARPGASVRRALALVYATWTTSRTARRHNAESARLAPLAADLLAACLASGAPPDQAAEAVGSALHPGGAPVGVAAAASFDLAARFHEVAALLRLGGHPVTCWRPLGGEPGLLPLSQAAARACLTGAPPAEAVAWTADDLRAARHSAGTAAARQAGVRAVAPLTGCFLPAFLLIGVIPVVIGLAQRLLP